MQPMSFFPRLSGWVVLFKHADCRFPDVPQYAQTTAVSNGHDGGGDGGGEAGGRLGVGDDGGEGGGDSGGGGGDGGGWQRTSPSLSTVGGEEGSGGGVPALLDSREFGPTIASWAGEHLQVGLRNHGMSGDWRGHVNDRHRTATQRPDVRAGSMPLLMHVDSSVPSDPHHGQLVALSTCDGGDPGWAKGLRQDPDPSAAPWEGAVDVMRILESEGAVSLGRGG